jgi:heme-degrading monooxygenase HmoA
VKFIFEIRIRKGYVAEQYADAWMRASEIIQRASGARGTRLHRKIGDPNVLIAIAEWDTKASRDAVQGALPAADEIIRAAEKFCEIRVIGEFEEPEWVVLPP